MANQGLTVRLHIEGARGTLKAFRDLPKDASDELREATLKLSETMASRVTAAGRSDSPQSALVAGTVKANRDRVPSISAGGAKRVGSNRKPAYKILFGSEFGSNRLKQFRPHLGRGSYWFFREVEDNQSDIADAWRKVADDVLKKWSNAAKGADN